MKKKTLTDKSGEVRELRSADIRAMRRAGEVLPPPLVDVLPRRKPGQRGPQKAPTKEQVTLRLDRDVLDRFRAAGPGWQRRINDALKRARAR
ncbi:MAG TPA: BrnA antitoxin family protein [Rhizomicrobium sp.]